MCKKYENFEKFKGAFSRVLSKENEVYFAVKN